MGIDPTIARLLFGFVTLMNPPVGIIMYLALAAFTPSEPAADGHMGAQAT
jgi:phage shock protein PspC (stress-responsive transcriptional regulator)